MRIPSWAYGRTAVVLVAGFFAVGLPWGNWPIVPAFIQQAIPKIGDAFLIAVIVGFLIDRTIKAELIRTFTMDISPHIIGNLLPTELREHMLTYLTVTLLRRTWCIDYTIAPAPLCDRCIELRTSSRYEMVNLSKFPQQYKSEYEIDDTWKCKKGRAEIKTFQVLGPTAGESCSLDGADLRSRNGSEHLTASTNVVLPASPHEAYSFLLESIEHFPDAFESSFIAKYPTLGCTVTVLHAKDQFHVNLWLSCDDAGLPPRRIELSHGTRWEIACPLLPGQSILVTWQPVKRAADQVEASGNCADLQPSLTTK